MDVFYCHCATISNINVEIHEPLKTRGVMIDVYPEWRDDKFRNMHCGYGVMQRP